MKGVTYMKKQRGMTLVELMMIVVIIGIMAAMAIPMLANKPDKVKACVREIHQAVSMARLFAMRDGLITSAKVDEFGNVQIIQYGAKLLSKIDDKTTKIAIREIKPSYNKIAVSPATEFVFTPSGETQQGGVNLAITDGATKLYVYVGKVGLIRTGTSEIAAVQ
jgi:prepilin-type N-terminal cleavage/methylation domain-containing protein